MLKFDEQKHTYTWNGAIIPSVTQILKPLSNFDAIPPQVLEHAKNRGIAVHYACELHDTNNLDWSTIHQEIKPYVDGWLKFKNDTGCEAIATEQRVFNKKYIFAGTLDSICVIDGEKWLIDRKATAKISPITALQTAAYSSCFDEPMRRAVVQLKKNGDYSFVEYSNKTDLNEFLIMLNAHRVKEKYSGNN